MQDTGKLQWQLWTLERGVRSLNTLSTKTRFLCSCVAWEVSFTPSFSPPLSACATSLPLSLAPRHRRSGAGRAPARYEQPGGGGGAPVAPRVHHRPQLHGLPLRHAHRWVLESGRGFLPFSPALFYSDHRHQLHGHTRLVCLAQRRVSCSQFILIFLVPVFILFKQK